MAFVLVLVFCIFGIALDKIEKKGHIFIGNKIKD